MLNYEVEIVNSILKLVFTNQSIATSYAIPNDENDIDRVTFDNWLESLGLEDEDVENVNWATAFLRLKYLMLFQCDSCICIPPMMLYMGFGVTKEEKVIFNTQKPSTIMCDCC